MTFVYICYLRYLETICAIFTEHRDAIAFQNNWDGKAELGIKRMVLNQEYNPPVGLKLD